LRLTPKPAYGHYGDQAPDDYAEFLFRTSSALMHEPTAAGRVDQARGRRAA